MAVGVAEASRLWPVAFAVVPVGVGTWRVAFAAVLVGVGTSVVDGPWRRVCGSVARSTAVADASSFMEGRTALVRAVAAAGVPLVLLASALGLALVLVSVLVPVLDFGAACVATVAVGVRSRSRSLQPVGASVLRSLSLFA